MEDRLPAIICRDEESYLAKVQATDRPKRWWSGDLIPKPRFCFVRKHASGDQPSKICERTLQPGGQCIKS